MGSSGGSIGRPAPSRGSTGGSIGSSSGSSRYGSRPSIGSGSRTGSSGGSLGRSGASGSEVRYRNGSELNRGGAAGGSTEVGRGLGSSRDSQRGAPISGVPDGDYGSRTSPVIRFPRSSSSTRPDRGQPGEGPSASRLARERSAGLRDRKDGQGRPERGSERTTPIDSSRESRSLKREDLAGRYKPGDPGRGGSDRGGGTIGKGDKSEKGRSLRDLPRLSDRRRGDRSDLVRGGPAPGKIDPIRADRGRGESGKDRSLGRPDRGAPGKGGIREDDRRGGRIGGGSTGLVREKRDGKLRSGDRPIRSRDEFRKSSPIDKRRTIKDLPYRNRKTAQRVRTGAGAISGLTRLGLHVGTSAAFGVTGGWWGYRSPWYGYNYGYWGGYYGSYCGYGWGFRGYYPWYGLCGPYLGWGWSFGFGWCWGNYWRNWDYYWNWYGPSYRTVYVYAPPAEAYSTVVYETVVYADDEEQEASAGEDVLVRDGTGVEGQAPLPAQREAGRNRAADYYLTLGDRAFRDSRYGDAVHYYAKAVDYSKGDGVLYLILSDSLFATGDYHYAAYALRKALELEPDLAWSVVDKHTFYSDPAEFDRQLAVLERYLEDHFEDADARLVLAANYLFGNRPAAAVDLLQSPFSEAVANSPEGKLILESAQAIQYGR